MPWLEIVLLAIVQGLGEFLPISSSGHVVILDGLFEEWGCHFGDPLTVNIVLHGGTLLTILVFYRRRLLDLLGRDRRMIGLLAVATVPAAIAGPLLKHYCEAYLESPLLSGAMLPVTGALLLWAVRYNAGQTECRDLSYRHAFLIGLAQALAILPGLSRSGTTIAASMACGMRRDEAATFSFLMAIPAIGGAMCLGVLHLLHAGPESVPISLLTVGAALSFVVGLVSVRWVVQCLQQGRLHYFAWWVIPFGLIVVAWRLIRLFGTEL